MAIKEAEILLLKLDKHSYKSFMSTSLPIIVK